MTEYKFCVDKISGSVISFVIKTIKPWREIKHLCLTPWSAYNLKVYKYIKYINYKLVFKIAILDNSRV